MVVVVTGGAVVVVTGGSEDGGAVVDEVKDGWLAEIDEAARLAAAPAGSIGWSESRTTQKVAARPAVRVAATAMGSFRLAVWGVLCRPDIRDTLRWGQGMVTQRATLRNEHENITAEC
ncbi:hypothetical protein [Lentzea flaviverrucosa]|uniref:Uncharacterized protein n=1 Tax=Lentzea flaviverrucosa TaxID=200379 RepID=A0A1H9CDZ0_9PSEU|nr:hypothetical protein DFR72_109102 [Lentzea flaviverrucosa]SEP99379.1 hypothetical protein SAMN05216195_101757 [Lentzea flaviverrucosa]